MLDNPERVTYFAETDFRNAKTRFGIKTKDRTRHMYIIGKTGMGKSTLLENLAIQDIQNGQGICFIDPHGSAAEKLLEFVPKERVQDVIYFAPFDLENPISFNVLEGVDEERKHLIAAGLMNAFKKIWQDAFSGRMEYILGMTLLALLDNPGETLLGVNRMYADKEYRKRIVANIKDPSVRAFWVDEYAKYSEKFAQEATAAIQNKIGQFTANPLIRNLVGQQESSFDFRDAMDQRKIIIVNLSKGKMGPDNMRLIGGMVVTKIYLAAMSRADVSAQKLKELPPFYLYVDEFQNFANESFAEILSESRKYNLALTVANQYIDQMEESVRGAIFGNVGSMVTFRVGAGDAEILEKEFTPYFTAEDLVNLGFTQVYLKLMIDGIGSQPFSANSLDTIGKLEETSEDEIIKISRDKYCKNRAEVERKIAEWFGKRSEPNVPKQGGTDKENFIQALKSKSEFQTTKGPEISERKTPDIGQQKQNKSQKGSFQEKNNKSNNDLKEMLAMIRNGEAKEVENKRNNKSNTPQSVEKKEDFVSLKEISKEKAPIVSENKNNLRSAIESALKERQKSQAESLQTKQSNATGPDRDKKSEAVEVPEDVLKDLLNI